MIRRALEEDLPEILQLQKLAFKEEADFVNDPNIKPMAQTLKELENEFKSGTILVYVEDGKIFGSVRASEEEGTCFITRMVVHPRHWRKGIGRNLMRAIEGSYSNVDRYELFTRVDHPRTRPFYQSLGYLPFRTERISDSLTFVYLQKSNKRGS